MFIQSHPQRVMLVWIHKNVIITFITTERVVAGNPDLFVVTLFPHPPGAPWSIYITPFGRAMWGAGGCVCVAVCWEFIVLTYKSECWMKALTFHKHTVAAVQDTTSPSISPEHFVPFIRSPYLKSVHLSYRGVMLFVLFSSIIIERKR